MVVLAFPIALLLLLLLPLTFASLALFAALYGAANGILTIVRGIAVPKILTRAAYGTINGVFSVPAAIAKAIAPLGIALLWAAAPNRGLGSLEIAGISPRSSTRSRLC